MPIFPKLNCFLLGASLALFSHISVSEEKDKPKKTVEGAMKFLNLVLPGMAIETHGFNLKKQELAKRFRAKYGEIGIRLEYHNVKAVVPGVITAFKAVDCSATLAIDYSHLDIRITPTPKDFDDMDVLKGLRPPSPVDTVYITSSGIRDKDGYTPTTVYFDMFSKADDFSVATSLDMGEFAKIGAFVTALESTPFVSFRLPGAELGSMIFTNSTEMSDRIVNAMEFIRKNCH